VKTGIQAALGLGLIGCAKMTEWCIMANRNFSYDGMRKLSKVIVEGTAEYVTIPECESAVKDRKYGFNIKSQLLKLLIIFPAVSALIAWICTRL